MTTEHTVPSDADLAKMSRDEMTAAGLAADHVELEEYGPVAVHGSPADKRNERRVAVWFLLAALLGLAFAVAFIWWPHEFVPAYEEGQLAYALYTPIIGLTMGGAILCFGIGVVQMARKIFAHEVAIQARHVGMSAEFDRQTLGAQVMDTVDQANLKRRGMIKGSLALAGGALGLVAAVPILGALIKNPWAERADAPLWVTPWAPLADGTKVRLVQVDGTPVRPEDLDAGSMATVFPGVPGGIKAADAAVMLFRVRSDQIIRIRDGQQGFQFGDYYAYSKICTHVGCPVSLYEQQTGRVLCPCHQSQFNLYEGMFPIFGPATRPLPQLPIELDDEGYFVAARDFVEAVGPGFWENGKFPAWYSEPKEATG